MPEPDSDGSTAASPSSSPATGRVSTRQIGKNAQEKSCSTSSKSVTDAIVLDAGPDIPIIDADEFIKDFLPRVPDTDTVVGRVVSWIENCPKYYARHRWKKFAQDPVKYKQREPIVFARLADVSNAIMEAVAEIMPELEAGRATRYVEKPTKPPETVFRQDLSRPDACFLFLDKFSGDGENPHWMDIAVAGEFKKSNNAENTEDDIKQVLWDMHQMMREDPRRRRCFGFTIENRDFRMYSSTRSEIVVSRTVDFLSSPSFIIRFFFALMYSPEEALGRDQTMTTIWNGDVHTIPQYDIRVQTRKGEQSPIIIKTFRTTKLISGIGAEAIRGRGTRVWGVHEVKDGEVDDSKEYILKDAWVDSDRMREGKVVASIRSDSEQLEAEQDKNALLSCLLTTFAESDVLLSDGTADCTISGRKRGRHIVKNDKRFSLTPYSSPPIPKSSLPHMQVPSKTKGKARKTRGGAHQTAGNHRDTTDDSDGVVKAIIYDAKTHYRIVFEEVCDVLHEITSLHKIMYTLWKACRGLEILHKLGWVHRDISSGNIMLCKDSVKITDFEYAKKMTLPGKKAHEIRTGTEDFMSVEVRAQRFKFLPEIHGAVRVHDADDADFAAVDVPLDDSSDEEPDPEEQPPSKFTWFYNPLHDIESIFWLAFYFTGNKDIVLGAPIERKKPYSFAQETKAQYHHRILAHWNFGLTLFSARSGREAVITDAAMLRDHLDENPLHPAISPLADVLCRLRNTLAQRYSVIEQNPPAIHHNSGGTLHATYKTLLRRAVVHLQNVPFDVQVRSLRGAVEKLPKSYQKERSDRPVVSASTVASTGSKRSRGCDDGDGRRSKSQRVSLDQTSPFQAASPKLSPPRGPPTEPKSTTQLPMRVLRSHSRKAAEEKTSPLSPRPIARTRKPPASKTRKVKPTKNHEAAKATAKVAATKVRSKTRKGR